MLRLFIVAVLLVASSRASAEVKVGEPPPDIHLDALLPDQPVANATLHALAGKAVILEFWATWCKPCVAEIPHFNDLATKFKDRPLVFLSVTDEKQAKVVAFLKEHQISGLIGIAHSTHLKEAYGVNGIPQAFLIDAKGNVAGALHPTQLRSATLENLLAGKAVPFEVMAPVDFSAIKRTEDGGPKALLDVLIRPSTNSDAKSEMLAGPGFEKMENIPLRSIVSRAYNFFEENRIQGEESILTAKYDLSVSLPGTRPQDMRAMARELIPAVFHVKVLRETRDTDVYVVSAPNGKPAALVAPTDEATWEMGGGKFKMASCTLPQLAFALEGQLHRPVIDETGIDGEYDLKLTYDANAPDGLLNALKGIGLKVDGVRRPIEFLVVTKAE